MSGSTTYNGHGLNEFVPQRTSAYVSQQDWFAVEMTVRETLDFAGRCQGVGFKYDMLVELARREKIAGIKPDGDLDIFMKSLALGEKETSLVVEYIMKGWTYALRQDILLSFLMQAFSVLDTMGCF
ncbi:ABC transporter G family member 31-like isoform X2 [Rosa chinensis]|uniref:ABC transporter G family member 31-like isoform X2 n=1 Tax=Rosa chinensis TaxID=74649 RepID=UPI000D097852|nr:ABC transporter G family member 31-like isoform X2 [Rosa chinensis]